MFRRAHQLYSLIIGLQRRVRFFIPTGFLGEKTCILITHQTQYLTDVDQIVLMDNVILQYYHYRARILRRVLLFFFFFFNVNTFFDYSSCLFKIIVP